MTLKYFAASQSVNKQTLRELRHQILARRSRRHPPADAIPGLDVAPLREHAWLDSLADAGVRVPSNFFDRLQEFATPNPPVVYLGDDNDSKSFDIGALYGPISTVMALDDNTEAVYNRRAGGASSKAPMVGESSRSGRQEEINVGPGTDVLWLPEEATCGPLTVEIDGPWHQDALDLSYPRTARNLYHMPSPYRLIVPSEGSIITECPPRHVAVYTHHFEFGLPFGFFFCENPECVQRLLGATNPFGGSQLDRVHLGCTLLGLPSDNKPVPPSSLVEEEWIFPAGGMVVVNDARQENDGPAQDDRFKRLARRLLLAAGARKLSCAPPFHRAFTPYGASSTGSAN